MMIDRSFQLAASSMRRTFRSRRSASTFMFRGPSSVILFAVGRSRLRDVDLRALLGADHDACLQHHRPWRSRHRRCQSEGLRGQARYRKTCHGLSAQGYLRMVPIPRLAGQQPQYLENQLHAFIERRRTNPIMANVAHALNPSMASALATHFRHLDPGPMGGAPRARWRWANGFTRRDFPNPTWPLLGLSRRRGQGPE